MAIVRNLLRRGLSYNPWLRSFSSTAAAPPPELKLPSPPDLPPFDYQPEPYKGPLADEVLQKRKKFLGPSLFYYYQKPVSCSLYMQIHCLFYGKKKNIAIVLIWLFNQNFEKILLEIN